LTIKKDVMKMEDFIRDFHVLGRTLVEIMTTVAFVWLLWGLFKKEAYDKRTHTIVAVWSGLIDLQATSGIILFVVLGEFDVRYRWEHAFIMVLAAVVGHAYGPLKKRPDTLRYQGGLASIVVVLVLVMVGVGLVK
jgi:hypothetical protein